MQERQAATPKGLMRRIRDLELNQVTDPRVAASVDHLLPAILTSLIASLVSNAGSLRDAEKRTEQIAAKHGSWLGVQGRIPDNTLGATLPRLDQAELASRLHKEVMAEHRRDNLKPTVLQQGTVAIDGKNVATLHWHDLCRVLEVDKNIAQPESVKALLLTQYPTAQLHIPVKGKPYALLRVHNATLISADPAVCVHQRPIPAITNEIGALSEVLQDLHKVYGRTALFSRITTDAGNTSLETASQTIKYGWQYFCQIKSTHGKLYAEAIKVLSQLCEGEAKQTYEENRNGKAVKYYLWRHDLGGQGVLDWTHARQLLRVQRIVEDLETGEKSIGNRFYVTSETTVSLAPMTCLKISRGHWRVENETHWTSDTQLMEDRRKHAWSRHPQGLLIVAILRMIAQNILAIARRLSRMDHTPETPSWRDVAQHFFLTLCESILRTETFDEV